MADQGNTVSTASVEEQNNTGNKDKLICGKCSDRESQLKEALEELSSAHKIIEILQIELQSTKAASTTCNIKQPSTTKDLHLKSITSDRTPSAHNNNTTKQQNLPIPTWADKAKTVLKLQTVNRNIAHNLKGTETKYHMTQKDNKGTNTQNLNGIKSHKISTIVNGIPDYLEDFPRLTRRKEENYKNKLHQKNLLNTHPVKSANTVKNKVLIIGDSHARNCATKLQDNLSSEFSISGYVKPGANMYEISKTVREELQTFKSDDFIVIWGGANDISKNNAKVALKLLSEFVIEHKGPNIVLINSPHRYDLIPESCVNQEVSKFNRKLNKIMKTQTHVKILELELNRQHYTRHGLHLNSEGKRIVSQNLALIIQNSFVENSPGAIPAPWKDTAGSYTIPLTLSDNISEDKNLPKYSFHQRRNCPAHRNPDFLWT